jgi:hypothetical protein
MSHPFTHPAGGALLERVASLYQSPGILSSKDRHIIFVCGGRASGPGANKTMRGRFIKYATSHLRSFRIFLAEAAYKDFVSKTGLDFFNVAQFETLIAQASDCLVLFPESPGSFAEAGFFAHADEIRKKILLVSDSGKQSTDSFINIGPIDLINSHSKFKPALQIPYSSRTSHFQHVRQRIQKRISTQLRATFSFDDGTQLSFSNKIYLVYDFVSLFKAIRIEDLEEALKICFPSTDFSALRQILSILIAGAYLTRSSKNEEFLVVGKNAHRFLEFPRPHIRKALEKRILIFYKAHATDSFNIARASS